MIYNEYAYIIVCLIVISHTYHLVKAWLFRTLHIRNCPMGRGGTGLPPSFLRSQICLPPAHPVNHFSVYFFSHISPLSLKCCLFLRQLTLPNALYCLNAQKHGFSSSLNGVY